jgi:sulfite reductase (NADPH) flavoprotein alpha-component
VEGIGPDASRPTGPARSGRPPQPVVNKNDSHQHAPPPHDVAHKLGSIESHARYADKSFGDRFMASIVPLHSDRYFGMAGVIVFMMASLAMPLFAITGWMLYLARRRRRKKRGMPLNAGGSHQCGVDELDPVTHRHG